MVDASALESEGKLITNRCDTRGGKPCAIEEKPFNTPVYDLSFVAYDKTFAEEFGLLPEHVTEMDEGLRWMEIRMVTEGSQTNCYYNVVLDKSVELDFPAENFQAKLHPFPTMPRLPFQELLKEQIHKPGKLLAVNKGTTPFRNRTLIASYNYERGDKRIGGMTSLLLEYNVQDRPVPYQLVSMQGGCLLETNIFTYADKSPPAIWIANKQGFNYNALIGISRDLFQRFTIPAPIIEKITPYLISNRALVHKSRGRKS